MSAKESDQDQSAKRPSTGSNELNRGRTTTSNGFRPTRNCGCNTEKQDE